jgi:hypothetical protein
LPEGMGNELSPKAGQIYAIFFLHTTIFEKYSSRIFMPILA